MAKAQMDQFANIAVVKVVESAANTLTFAKLETGMPIFEKIAWIIHRLEYHIFPDFALLDARTDTIEIGLAVSNQLLNLNIENVEILHKLGITRSVAYVTTDSSRFDFSPVEYDLSTLPGGGIIVPPNPLYGFVMGTGETGPYTARIKFYYTTKQLEAAEFWELVEARRIISNA